jgi:hypothetical protein
VNCDFKRGHDIGRKNTGAGRVRVIKLRIRAKIGSKATGTGRVRVIELRVRAGYG